MTEETIHDRHLRPIVEREVMSNPPAAIPPVPGAVAPILGDEDEDGLATNPSGAW